jgi:cell division protein FtsI/penicillin-binding protein 2
MVPGMQPAVHQQSSGAVRRVRVLFAFVVVLMGVFLVRAFYLQVIQHNHYRQAALSDQLRQYEIPATRGVIKAHSGDAIVPIVLNQKLYTLYADPTLVKDASRAAETVAATIGGDAADYAKKMEAKGTSYMVLARRVPQDKRDAIIKKKYPGIGAQEVLYRTYPNGQLASQLLGFVNDEGKGVYGIEQALNKDLSGRPGQLKAVTDVNGVPLAASTGNVQEAPVEGKDVVLTIDMAMQQQLENILQQGLKNAKSNSGSALVLEADTGAIKAMANWPTYDPANYAAIEDSNVFANPAVSSPLEVGSVMKPLTTAAALDMGAITADQSYEDPSSWKIDGFTIKNIEEDGGPGRKNIADILNLSLNTGATWELMQMSKPGGTEINEKGRKAWYGYMTDRFRFGKLTGIEQGYEAEGTIPDPVDGYARDLTYANTSFGQAMTATPLQMAGAFAAMMNGGTYYQPRLVDQWVDADGKTRIVQPKVLKTGVVSPQVSKDMQKLLQYVVDEHYFKPSFDQGRYSVGGKTGTAQIERDGKYLEHDFNGTYLGFVGGDKAQYIIAVRVNEPKIAGYAGSQAAQPLFGTLAHMLIDNFGVTPRTQ